jgi:hypothetical protein
VTNRRTWEARHNEQPLPLLLASFRLARGQAEARISDLVRLFAAPA